jgi:hypothetical protein
VTDLELEPPNASPPTKRSTTTKAIHYHQTRQPNRDRDPEVGTASTDITSALPCGVFTGGEQPPGCSSSPKMGEPPDELQHITADVLPLSLLLSRLAQFSHAKLQELILSLASKPLPEALSNGNLNSGVNGSAKPSASAGGAVLEDTSPESLDKKTMVLNFIQDLHSRWVKALVITEWAKNADEVGKLIDLRTHLAEKLDLYNRTFWELVAVKQEMVFAKVPSPDLKTALEVLSRGSVHWMPDVGCNRPSICSLLCANKHCAVRLPAQTSSDDAREAALAQRNRGDLAYEVATARV